MSLTLGRFTWASTITAGTNNAIHWTEGGTTVLTTTLPTQTYNTPEDLANAMTLAMTTASGVHTYTASVSSTGYITFTIDSSTMGTSTHAEGFTLAHLAGFSDGVADTGTTNTGTYQASSGFYFKTDGPDLETGTHSTTIDWMKEHENSLTIAMDGSSVSRPVGSTRKFTSISINHMPASSTHADDYPNQQQTLEHLFNFINGGNSRAFRWYLDASDTTAWTTVHWEPMGQTFTYQPQRADPGLARWAHPMKLRINV